MSRDDTGIYELAEDLAKVAHAQGGHAEQFFLCQEPRCLQARAVLYGARSYAGPTATDLCAMGEIRNRAAAGA